MEALRYLFKASSERQSESDLMLREAEALSVADASPTPGFVEFIEACKETGRPLVVVSNNSPEAVSAFLESHDLTSLVDGVFGCSTDSPELIKPHPYLLELTLKELPVRPSDCLMVDDSVTDIQAAKAVDVLVVGYANQLGKAESFRSQGRNAITEDMTELAREIWPTKPVK
ncbi:HAD family hydrolase [Nocardiopsis dassonvillei]|uniref:HAD family hydrolase n=1 Tax=Nocardiopsis dassonvillei TaxID=2014 RepID=UPI003F55A9DE